jgi:hypothetical protein
LFTDCSLLLAKYLPIADHKQLHVKQTVIAPKEWIDLVEGFDARTFEFYLYQGKPLTVHNGSYNFLPD